MLLETDGKQVFLVKEINTGKQVAIIKEHHCMFYKSKLLYSNGAVICEIYNYLDEFQEDYNELEVFECEGHTIEVQVVDGIAEITIDIPQGETVVIRTINENMTNGEVTIYG